MDFPSPRVFISKCLGFESCRYNGQTILDPVVKRLVPHVECITACPEVEIGLGVPRQPVRLVESGEDKLLFQPATGREVTAEMSAFTSAFFDNISVLDGFILKSRSPSCGPWQVKSYNSMKAQSSMAKGRGIFGGYVVDAYPGYPIEDEGRLRNFTIREHFFTSLFTLTRFREVKQEASMRGLVDFHTRAKLLFMAYNQEIMRELGKITANHDQLDLEEMLERYETRLRSLFSEPPRFTNMINAFQHAFGGLSENLLPKEREFFLNSLEEYRDERIPAGTIIHLLVSWAIRFDNQYLLDQYLMAPYPPELVEITDSGKGRSY